MLENPRSPRVRAVAKLARKSERIETGLFLLEGPQSVAEALSFRPDLFEELFVTPTAWEKFPAIAKAAKAEDIEVLFVSEQVLDSMADTVTPQGFVASVRQFATAVKDIFAAESRLIAILEEVRDPGNAGTIIRAADAAGADAVIFSGRTVDLYNPKVVRASTGSLFHLPIAVGVNLGDVVQRTRAAGMQVFAADISGLDLPEVRLRLSAPTAWLFGNEAAGLAVEKLALADLVVKVPIYGNAESLNLASAASICLYESAFALRS